MNDNACEHLLHQGAQEVGSITEGTLQELKIVHPEASHEKTFAIEIGKNTYFPIQDQRFNVTALRGMDGNIVQFSRFSPFGEEAIYGDTSFVNPWRYANRRQIEGLSLYSKRFYNPGIMRWMTPDPLGFVDGLNIYAYVHNNPLRYFDPDGQFAIFAPLVIKIFTFSWGAAEAVADLAIC